MKLVIASYRLGEMPGGLGETCDIFSYRLGEMPGGFGETGYSQL